MADEFIDKCQTILAPAKLNLGLSIVGVTANGYHQLQSIFWPITLCDELVIEERVASLNNTDRVTAEWHGYAPLSEHPLPSEHDNLVWKALQLVRCSLSGRADIRNLAWQIHVTKKIPMGAGLGGGSSDAGATIRTLRSLAYRNAINLSCADIAKLGADIAYFLDARPAWVTGIGEVCEYLDLTPQFPILFLLVLLPKPISTQVVFKEFDRLAVPLSHARSARPSLGNPVEPGRLRSYLASAKNDLEKPAIRIYPLIDQVLSELRGLPHDYVGMSGSGSSCFGVYSSKDDRERAHSRLINRLENLQCKLIKAETFCETTTPKRRDGLITWPPTR